MKFVGTSLQGAWIIEAEPSADERGSSSKTFCSRQFRERGLEWRIAEATVFRLALRHTLRGLQWQTGQHSGTTLVQCVRGRLLDVVVDLRSGSPTFGQHEKIVLGADSGRMLYVPKGCAHGFLTLDDDTWVHQQMSSQSALHARRGVRWNDPRLAIAWPAEPRVISSRDRSWPDLDSSLIQAEAKS